ncbi:MAG: DUF4097 family beta strand repeat-containing protein [Oscillospiraceae bacterium]
MKRAKKITLLIALACVAAGAAISLGALAVIGFDVSRLNTMKFENNTYQVEESFSHIRIEGAECDVRLLPSRNGACTVVCSEGKNISHTVTVDGDTLKITRTDSRKWYERMGIYWGDEMSVTIYLPERVYGDLFIRSVSGDITVPVGFTFTQSEIVNTSGEIAYAAGTESSLTLKTTSGDLTVRDLTAGALEIRSTSGEVTIHSAVVSGDVVVETVSGEIELEGVNAQAMSIQSTSGDVELADTVAAGHIEIKTVSGEIELERSDAETLRIKSTSGDVSGSLLTEKRFTTHTTSGSVNVPNIASPAAGTCEITTTSGNIRLNYVN